MIILNAVSNIDPTRTLALRRAFSQDMSGRFRELAAVITKSISDNDAFGLKTNRASLTAAEPNRFDFPRSAQKIESFMNWLNEQEEKGILEQIQIPRTLQTEPWSNIYIRRAYKRGIVRARQELRKLDSKIPAITMQDPSLSTALSQPVHADRLGLCFTRAFSELKGIDDAMDQQISRALADGLLAGESPLKIAKRLTTEIGKMDRTRARMLARTEVIRAHHSANMGEYRNWGAEGIKIDVEFGTAGHGVCPSCQSLDGKIFTLDEAETLIPVHPNCRCFAAPVITDFD